MFYLCNRSSTDRATSTPTNTRDKENPTMGKDSVKFQDLDPRAQKYPAINLWLYRGSSGSIAKAVMDIAVGPARAVATDVADALEQGKLSIAPTDEKAFLAYFSRTIPGKTHVYPAGSDLVGRLRSIIEIMPNLAPSHLDPVNHVLPEATVTSPSTAQSLESTSTDPRAAILYAYGLSLDEWFVNSRRQCKPYSKESGINADAFVAVLTRPQSYAIGENGLKKILSQTPIAGCETLASGEAERRAYRDSEVLLGSVIKPKTLVELPEFDPLSPEDSLNAAAKRLVEELTKQ
jgi:hypothetical protein